MKQLFFLSVFFICVSVFGQSSSTLTRVTDVLVLPVDSISWTDLEDGFARNASVCHCRYQLDSNSTFTLYSQDCVSTIPIDNGVWEIKSNNTLILKSKEEVKVFHLITVSGCRFFIPPNKIQIFKKDLKTFLAKYKPTNPSKYLSWHLMFELGHKYFCRRLQLTGT